MTTLILTLPPPGADATALYDHVHSGAGTSANAHASVPLGLLPTTHDNVVALVPAQALSWHQVKLPAGSVPRTWSGERSSARLRSILAGALEDQLLDDPALLHLALQPQATADALVWVAACDRSWLKAALNTLAQAGHVVTRIVPEFTPQALQGTVMVTGNADQPQVAGLQRLPAVAGESGTEPTHGGLLACPLSAAALTWLGETDTPHQPPHAAPTVVAEPAVAALAEQAFKRPVVLQQRAERLLQAAQSPWDLAQFDLAHAARDRRWASVTRAWHSVWQAPQWRAARLAMVALLLVNLFGLNAWALREQATLNVKRQAVRAMLLETFPKVPVVVDAPLQMAREVAALQRASGTAAGADLERLLASFSAVVPAGYMPTAIEFEANELRIKGPAVSDTASMVSSLKALGVRASLQGEQWQLSGGGLP